MSYEVVFTDGFSKTIKKHKHNTELLEELEKKLVRLKENPQEVGGLLKGKLHGYHSTRLAKKFRVIFQIEETQVILIALNHRSKVYE